MYKQISSNRWKSSLLIGVFIGVLSLAGYAYGMVTESGYTGVTMAFTISVGMTLFSWFLGDKVVLATSGAREILQREENPYLWNLIENLAITAGIPRPRLYVVDDPSPNAFATGRDPAHASVAVTTGIVSLLENEELEGVIAHELSHIKNRDTRLMMLAAVLVGAITLLGDFFLHGSLFGRRRSSDREGGGLIMILGIIFLILSPIIGQLIQLAISRRREYLADASGALLTRYPEGLARALEKIHQANIPLERASQATAHLWIADPSAPGGIRRRLQGLFSTHPPIEERIQELYRMTGAR